MAPLGKDVPLMNIVQAMFKKETMLIEITITLYIEEWYNHTPSRYHHTFRVSPHPFFYFFFLESRYRCNQC